MDEETEDRKGQTPCLKSHRMVVSDPLKNSEILIPAAFPLHHRPSLKCFIESVATKRISPLVRLLGREEREVCLYKLCASCVILILPHVITT